MTAIWPGSRIPYIDTDGDPMVGAQLYFYDVGTTTPQPVWSSGSLATTLDQPVLADARGMFPAIYLSPTPGNYRVKMLDADGATIFDDDDISVPQDADYVPPDAGETSETLLLRTGMLQPYYGTTSPSGWVRAAGRTIGTATSGATERANADCEDLFLHLWGQDSTLTVSSGRGASAAGDWAANKTITLPDFRERAIVGLATMGNSDAGLIADALVDGGETTSALGATAGAGSVTLSEAQIPSHTHTATFTGAALPAHSHTVIYGTGTGGSDGSLQFSQSTISGLPTGAASAGTPTGTVAVANTGGGTAHTNLQPSQFATILIKL